MTQETEDVVAELREQLWLAAKIGGTLTPKMPQVDAFDAVLAENKALSDRIDVLEAGAELLFERLEHLRDTSGTETRLERGNRAAYHSALEIARATLKARAALHQEGIDG